MSTTWSWVVAGYDESAIISGVGPRWGKQHKGIDIAAPKGTNVGATRAGTVIDVYTTCSHNYGKKNYRDPEGCGGGYGNRIYIDHGDGYVSRYAHLTDVYVRVGDKVSQGQVIGTVGSTGNSGGFHLHFEIRLDGEVKDPENYISSKGPTVVNTDDHKSNSDIGIFPTVPIDASGTTVGQRVSGATRQPIHAFVNIYVGSDLVPLATNPPKPNILQMFEYNRLQDAGETASFTLFDDNWEEIEAALYKNFDRIYIEYGYPGTGLKSKLIKHRLLNYSVSFVSTGTIISVSTVTEGAYNNLRQKSIAINTYNPTEAVKIICRELGYTVLDENFEESQDVSADNPFNMIAEYPITYIQNHIIPQAAQENEELFSFNIDADGVAYFKRESYNVTSTDNMRTYIYQRGYDSPIINLDFDLKGVFGGLGDFNIATEYKGTLFDTKNKEQKSYEANKSSVITVATGDSSMTASDQSDQIIDNAGYTPEQMKNRLYYYMKSMRYDAYEATMTIIGDPTISLNEYVRIINVTDRGSLHHTSGVYRISDITDTVQGGEMTTSLKLVRNASYNIDGVELLNPKLIIK